MKGMTTCKVCGRDFALIIEDHYVAEDPQKVGALANLINTDRAQEHDAFDCPHCGCQNVMQSRKPIAFEEGDCPCDYGICDECDHTEERKESGPLFESCNKCVYHDRAEDEEPCVKCKHCYVDHFEPKEEDNE